MSSDNAGETNKMDLASTRAEADWFSRLRKKPIDRNTDREFQAWLAENPEHESDYERCELIWELCKDIEDDPEIVGYIDECDALIAKRSHKNRSFFIAWSTPIALAASVLAFALVTMMFLQLPSEELFISAVGEQRSIILEDGSNVVLNTNTRLAVRYTSQQRSIDLYSGEALFTVTKDPNRPFTVHAANGMAKAVGTRFNVRHEDRFITVSVLEGIVDVSPESDGADHAITRLTEGQAVNYYDGVLAQTSAADLVRIEAWRAGKLDFDSARLMDVIAEHNRYTKTKIVIADDSIKDLLVSGIFRVGENEPLLFALENSFNIRAVNRGKSVMLVAGSRSVTAPEPERQ